MTILVDTHIWIWWVNREPQLTEPERIALEQAVAVGEVAISAISLWEAQVLHSRGRLRLDVPFDTWILATAATGVVQVLALDLPVVLALNGLPATMHSDPADRIIVATARAHDLPLMTHDRAIRTSGATRVWAP